MGDKPCVYIIGHAELLYLGQHIANGFCLSGAGLIHLNVVVGVNDQSLYAHCLYCGCRPAQNRIQRVGFFPIGVDEHKVFMYPFKRFVMLCLRHPFLPFKESFLCVNLHQPTNVDVGLVFKRAYGELPTR